MTQKQQKQYVYNISIKTPKGIESDTLYSDRLISREDAEQVQSMVDCDIIIALVGFFTPYSEKHTAKNAYYVAKGEQRNEITQSV